MKKYIFSSGLEPMSCGHQPAESATTPLGYIRPNKYRFMPCIYCTVRVLPAMQHLCRTPANRRGNDAHISQLR